MRTTSAISVNRLTESSCAANAHFPLVNSSNLTSEADFTLGPGSELGRRLGVSAEFLATGKDVESTDDPLLTAELALRLGRHAEARAAFEAVLADCDSPLLASRARMGLGLVAFESGEHEDAIELLE